MTKFDLTKIPEIKVPTTMEIWHSIAYKLLLRQVALKAKTEISDWENQTLAKIDEVLGKFNNADRKISREPQLFKDMKSLLESINNADKEAENANNQQS